MTAQRGDARGLSMRNLSYLSLPLLLVMGGCGDGGSGGGSTPTPTPAPANSAPTFTSAATATVVEGAVSGPEKHSTHRGGPTAGDQAFAASEAQMHRLMAAASGETVDQAYIAKMIAHHQGAVAMAEVALRDSRDPEVRRMGLRQVRRRAIRPSQPPRRKCTG